MEVVKGSLRRRGRRTARITTNKQWQFPAAFGTTGNGSSESATDFGGGEGSTVPSFTGTFGQGTDFTAFPSFGAEQRQQMQERKPAAKVKMDHDLARDDGHPPISGHAEDDSNAPSSHSTTSEEEGVGVLQ